LGWALADEEGHPIAWWGGVNLGSNFMLLLAPEDELAVVTVTNATQESDWMPWYSYDIGYAALQELLGVESAEIPLEGEAAQATLDTTLVTEIESYVAEMMAANALPGFALGVVKDGELAYAQGFGVTNLESGEAVTSRTLFQLAEISMTPTAMAVLQLVEAGQIDLDAPVTDYLPYFRMRDEGYREITVRHLLTNRSGIPDTGDTMADWENFMPQYDSGATERWVRSLADTGLLFAPDSGFEYSALGYALLGDVIAKASGQTYEAYVQEHILTPLGMQKSTFLLEEVDRQLLASPHVVDAAGDLVASPALPYHRPFAAANNLFSNVEEMAKLAQVSLNRGSLGGTQILSAQSSEQMWTAHSPTPFGDFPFGALWPSPLMVDWGYGWLIGDIEGHPVYNSFGREHGYHAGMLLCPDAELVVIAMGNGPITESYYAYDTATDVMGMLLESLAAQ
jgi:CubicO group peptidase (beta-lactamase class C family)